MADPTKRRPRLPVVGDGRIIKALATLLHAANDLAPEEEPDRYDAWRAAVVAARGEYDALVDEVRAARASAATGASEDGFAHCSECGVVIHCAGTSSPHPDLRGAAKDLLREVRHVPGLSSAGAIRLVEAAQRVERILNAPSTPPSSPSSPEPGWLSRCCTAPIYWSGAGNPYCSKCNLASPRVAPSSPEPGASEERLPEETIVYIERRASARWERTHLPYDQGVLEIVREVRRLRTEAGGTKP